MDGANNSNGRERTEAEFRIFRAACRLNMANDKGLSGNAFKLGFLISEFADHENPEPFPGQERLAELMGKDERTIRTLTNELVERGHLVIVEIGRKGKNSVYRMVSGGRKLPPEEASENATSRKFSSKSGGKKASTQAEENFRPSPIVGTPVEGIPTASSEGKIPANSSRTKQTPAVNQPAQSQHHGVHHLQPVDITVAKPEIGQPLADNVIPIRSLVPINGVGKSQRRLNGANHDFGRFWEIFPRDNENDVRLAAMKFHAACKLPGVDAEIIISGAESYAAECAANPQKWKKAAHNWLIGECWNNVPQPRHSSSSVDPAIQRFGSHRAHLLAALNMPDEE